MSTLARQKSAIKGKMQALRKELAVQERKLGEVEQVYSGDLPSPDQANRIKNQKFSFTVHFVRSKRLRKVRSPGMVCRSLRRFGSRKEAVQHGKRFSKRHRHESYRVIQVSQRANAWVNWRTGKTNPVLNK